MSRHVHSSRPRRRRNLAGFVATVALLALAPGSASASAGPQYNPDDPAYMTEPCKHDTSPSYPSCGGPPR